MKLIGRLLWAFLIFLTIFLLVEIIVWFLPGTLADVLSDSQTNLMDLKLLAARNRHDVPLVPKLLNFLRLDWGESILYHKNNFKVIWEHFQLTLAISVLSLIFIIGIVLGFFRLRSKHRGTALRLAAFLMAIPGLVFFPAIIFLTCKYSSVCPAGSANIWGLVTMAALAQAILSAPRFFREVEWEVESMLRKRFVLVLRAKGVANRRILWVHVFTNVLPPFLSLLVLTWISFISGSVLLEALFDIPGTGALLLEALRARDLPLIFSLVVFLSTLHFFFLSYFRPRRVYE